MSESTIRLSTTVAAAPGAVFRALTDADELARWFPSSAESEPRTGGRFTYRFEFDDASRNHTYSGAYHEVTSDERVSYPWQGRLGTTRVDFTLTPSDEGTHVKLVHSGWGKGADWDEAVEMHRQGWGAFLDNLKSYLETGEDRRSMVLEMRTPARV
jgi:uncharacterized protein YndB with AHSA1/START domain